ncbi:ArsR/SmtB family transcription factor [Pediococcus pentosaceus]|uniref:ArsR/SmtB family transcription factor n=1 Tax=Pediococcus pentosaceus TaxID=1255 RepID=UPI00110931D8|nr:metalloregulator ArsR/SmtB family transcription factor [Pediococcus pentosaceus]KAF0421935.1 metalloregulator ArsR/SmtB family transcription factor [Pediococcus pentosaceus]MBF7130573.1 helix-turn-helix transcriptional regulator [Pediococcus pentosaceus]MBF7136367.1 helix-turn-helix transcriptional regulator [Pediococcus pentosaceus]TLQ02475.1 helix-turn-helix transcriptional regulator [Pediococcus pentosaceus]
MTNFNQLKQDLNSVSEFLVTLGDEKRQSIIIRLLSESNCDGLQVGELTEATGLSRPAVSHHLKVLKEAKIVDYRTNGTRNYYYLTHHTEEILKLKNFIDELLVVMEESK